MAELAMSVGERQSAEGPFTLVVLAGEADASARRLEHLLAQQLAAKPRLLVLELTQLTFMDSWALHTILTAGQDLHAAGGTLMLANPCTAVHRVLELSGADQVLPVQTGWTPGDPELATET